MKRTIERIFHGDIILPVLDVRLYRHVLLTVYLVTRNFFKFPLQGISILFTTTVDAVVFSTCCSPCALIIAAVTKGAYKYISTITKPISSVLVLRQPQTKDIDKLEREFAVRKKKYCQV
jgi:hypothetical protein